MRVRRLLAATLTAAAFTAAGCSSPPAHLAPAPQQTVAVTVAVSHPPHTRHHRRPVPHTPPGSKWDKLAACESSHRWHIVDAPYRGGLQFKASTWRSFGGLKFARYANRATRDEQIVVARRVLHSSEGWHAWPVCSVKEGLA